MCVGHPCWSPLQEADLAVLSGVRIGYASVTPPPALPAATSSAPAPSVGSGAVFASYDPSVVVAGSSVYLLATEYCLRVALRPWSERIEALVKSGDWLPALALAAVRGLRVVLSFASETGARVMPLPSVPAGPLRGHHVVVCSIRCCCRSAGQVGGISCFSDGPARCFQWRGTARCGVGTRAIRQGIRWRECCGCLRGGGCHCGSCGAV